MKSYMRINLEFTYHPERSGAHYRWKNWAGIEQRGNSGELIEALIKSALGLDPIKDAATPWNMGADIPEYGVSCKSSMASLTSKPIADTFEDSLRVYFQNVAASAFWFGLIEDDYLIIYKMDAVKFEAFLRKFSKLNERGVIRIAKYNTLMSKWLSHNA